MIFIIGHEFREDEVGVSTIIEMLPVNEYKETFLDDVFPIGGGGKGDIGGGGGDGEDEYSYHSICYEDPVDICQMYPCPPMKKMAGPVPVMIMPFFQSHQEKFNNVIWQNVMGGALTGYPEIFSINPQIINMTAWNNIDVHITKPACCPHGEKSPEDALQFLGLQNTIWIWDVDFFQYPTCRKPSNELPCELKFGSFLGGHQGVKNEWLKSAYPWPFEVKGDTVIFNEPDIYEIELVFTDYYDMMFPNCLPIGHTEITDADMAKRVSTQTHEGTRSVFIRIEITDAELINVDNPPEAELIYFSNGEVNEYHVVCYDNDVFQPHREYEAFIGSIIQEYEWRRVGHFFSGNCSTVASVGNVTIEVGETGLFDLSNFSISLSYVIGLSYSPPTNIAIDSVAYVGVACTADICTAHDVAVYQKIFIEQISGQNVRYNCGTQDIVWYSYQFIQYKETRLDDLHPMCFYWNSVKERQEDEFFAAGPPTRYTHAGPQW